MIDRLVSLLRKALLIWGGVSLVLVFCALGLIAYRVGFGNTPQVDSASTRDVRFVLNGCGLGESRIERVAHSYVSSRSFTGDHLDAYAIKISHVSLAELGSTDRPSGSWYRGDQLPAVVSDAVGFIGGVANGDETPWFPAEAELRTMAIYIFPESMYLHGVTPTSVQLVFVRPSDNMLFYVDIKT